MRHARYRVFDNRTEADGFERTLWDDYYASECAARGLTPGVDSLDVHRGRVLPLARGVTAAAASVVAVAESHVAVLATEIYTPLGRSDMVTRDELPQPIRDELPEASRADTAPDARPDEVGPRVAP